MSLYGHTLIKRDSLKRWVNSLKIDGITSVDVGGISMKLEDIENKILKAQLEIFQDHINKMSEEDDWRKYEYALSPIFYNVFVRVDNSSIKIGDYFECLIEPCNVKSYKKIIKGFDYIDIGAIHIKDSNDNLVASIGQKSDLIWRVFYDYFINQDESGNINHVYSNHDRYLSIQLYDVENNTLDEIKARTNEILLHVSMKYDMDFKIFEVDPLVKGEGDAPIVREKYSPIGLEEIPMFYLMNANSTNDERYQFLSYYQVIEFFFVRAQNYAFLNDFENINISCINHNDLRKALCNYKKKSNERDALKLVLKDAINISTFKEWMNSSTEYIDTYCNSFEDKVDLSKSDEKIINSIAERVYKYRCAIAHAKGDMEDYIAVPVICRETIRTEIPLVKYLSYEVIKRWSGR